MAKMTLMSYLLDIVKNKRDLRILDSGKHINFVCIWKWIFEITYFENHDVFLNADIILSPASSYLLFLRQELGSNY